MAAVVGIVSGITAILLCLITIAGLVFALGKRDAKIDQLETRAAEDRNANDKRFEELYKSRNEQAGVMTKIGEQMKNLSDALAELKDDFKEGIKELRADINGTISEKKSGGKKI